MNTNTSIKKYYQPKILSRHASLVAAESRRQGGVSPSPYESLNLGLYTQDASKNVRQNRRLFFEALGIDPNRVAGMHQVHGHEVKIVEQPGEYPGYDALVTNVPDLFLTVTVADCVPILLYDKKQEAVAAIHAGWRGTRAGIVGEALARMQESFGTKPENCLCFVGTCIDECSYEVDADVADHFGAEFKRWDEEKQKFFLDLKKANRAQLLQKGLLPENIELSPFSTVVNNDRYFSYRKEKGQTGRMLGLIGRRKY